MITHVQVHTGQIVNQRIKLIENESECALLRVGKIDFLPHTLIRKIFTYIKATTRSLCALCNWNKICM